MLGCPHGTIKRWLLEGMPARRTTDRKVWIQPEEAREWVSTRFPKGSLALRRASSVYIAQRVDGPVKIGWTSDVLRRVAELRKESNQNVVLAACLPGTKSTELSLHSRFADRRLEGEWFDIDVSDAIEALRAA